MIINTECKCGHINQSSITVGWINKGSVPVSCSNCSCVYMATAVINEPQDTEPQFKIDSSVKIVNENNELFGKNGVVVDCDDKHEHYKIKFEDDKLAWVPGHWIEQSQESNNDHNDHIKTKKLNYKALIGWVILLMSLYGFYSILKSIWEII